MSEVRQDVPLDETGAAGLHPVLDALNVTRAGRLADARAAARLPIDDYRAAIGDVAAVLRRG